MRLNQALNRSNSLARVLVASQILLTFGACAPAFDHSGETHVSLDFARTQRRIEDPALRGNENQSLSASYCYAVHVTATTGAGLNRYSFPAPANPGICQQPISQLGKSVGLLSVGATAEVSIPAGADRRIELIGFSKMSRDGLTQVFNDDCSGLFEMRPPVDSTQLSPDLYYRGAHVVESVDVKLFYRSDLLQIVSGAQTTATLNPQYDSELKFGVPYGCGDQLAPADPLYISDSALLFYNIDPSSGATGIWLYMQNMGSTPITQISVANPGGPFAKRDDYSSCSGTLEPGISCALYFEFDPSAEGSFTQEVPIQFQSTSLKTKKIQLSGNTPSTYPHLTANLSRVHFGSTTIANPQSKTVVFKNTGTASTKVSSFTKPYGAFDLDESASTCQSNRILTPSQSCSAVFKFAPPYLGYHASSVYVSTYTQSLTLSLEGYAHGAPAPYGHLDFSENQYHFGSVETGVSLADHILVVSNRGNAPAKISSISMVSGDPHFQIYPTGTTCAHDTILAPSGSCNIKFRYAPQNAGSHQGMIHIYTYAGQFLSYNFTGNGWGAPPASGRISTQENRHHFGSLVAGAENSEKIFTITNTGAASIKITSAYLSWGYGNFMVVDADSTCQPALSLAPAGTCVVKIRFMPQSPYDVTGGYSIYAETGQWITINLDGTGYSDIDPGAPSYFVANASEVYFGSVNPTAGPTSKSIRFTNLGQRDITSLSSTLTGSASISTNASACAGAVPIIPGEFCDIVVTYDPTVAEDSQANLNLVAYDAVTGGGNSTAYTSFPILGQAYATASQDRPAFLVVNAAYLNFGMISPGNPVTKTFTITNAGDHNASAVNVSTYDPFSSTDNCGATLTAHSSCTVTLTFNPLTPQSAQNYLYLNYTDSVTSYPGTHYLPMQGIAYANTPANIPGTMVVNSSDYHFGKIDITSSGETKVFQITNIGDQILTLSPGSLSPPFEETANTCTTLAKNESCEVAVKFLPVQVGPVYGQFVTNATDENSVGSSVIFNLYGIGEDP